MAHWVVLNDPTVTKLALYRPKSTWLRLDVAPFIVAYAVLHGYATYASVMELDTAFWLVLVVLPLILSLHILLFFISIWSVSWRCMISLVEVKSVSDATIVRVIPALHQGVETLVELCLNDQEDSELLTSVSDTTSTTNFDSRSPIMGPNGEYELLSSPAAFFVFQKTSFWWIKRETSTSHHQQNKEEDEEVSGQRLLNEIGKNRDTGLHLDQPHGKATEYHWCRVEYPTNSKLSSYYTSCNGYSTQAQYEAGGRRWGDNTFDIPSPKFSELLAEHAVAPMFVFQMICVGLWSLDEHWYYAIFTLIMLVIFESTVCYQRLQSLSFLRQMLRPPYAIRCYRFGMWRTVSTKSLLPGDIVSIAYSKASKEQVVPCDLLLLHGSCIVNESSLTGESVPQRKDSLAEQLNQPQFNNFSSAADAIAADANRQSINNNTTNNEQKAEEDDKSVELGDEKLCLGTTDAAAKRHRRFIIFGGTQVLQHEEKSKTTPSSTKSSSSTKLTIPKSPDGGCICLVLRTGFESSQGNMMRIVLFASERITANSNEAAMFIAVLLVFALIAAWYVLSSGLLDERRNRFKLYLHCIMIITSVVPPELPMELSLAVTNSLAALTKYMVFCTEPFRIPFAGKVDVCCFDKTGTLTSDNLEFLGIALAASSNDNKEDNDNVKTASSSSDEIRGETLIKPEGMSALVIGCCHELVMLDGDARGDPMEKALQQASGFGMMNADLLVQRPSYDTPPGMLGVGMPMIGSKMIGGPSFVKILRRLSFSSDIRRMSVVVSVNGPVASSISTTANKIGMQQDCLVLTKGAPEAILPLLKKIPEGYSEAYLHHMSQGLRVIALACKPTTETEALRSDRKALEGELDFVGFACLDCPLKRDSKQVIEKLTLSGHRCVMITGDSVLTGAEVGKRVGMIPHDQPSLVLTTKSLSPSDGFKGEGGGGGGAVSLVWQSLVSSIEQGESSKTKKYKSDNGGKILPPPITEMIPFDLTKIDQLASNYGLCLTGDSLESLRKLSFDEHPALLSVLVNHVTIYARVAPHHKEWVVEAINNNNKTTLMCGDGTNDMGALKKAHVGISLMNNPELEQRTNLKVAMQGQQVTQSLGKDLVNDQQQEGKEQAVDSLSSMMKSMLEAEAVAEIDRMDPTIVQLGDASLASPFTAKSTSLDCVLTVVRQGRTSLVTTTQVYKILALNCLVSAFMLSTLYLYGVKQGDTQMTVLGLFIAALFYFSSIAAPLEDLSKEKPIRQLFCLPVIFSVIGQSSIHIFTLLKVVDMCRLHTEVDDGFAVPDGEFRPNLLNSLVFMLSTWVQLNTFAVNYCGYPFTTPLRDNKFLWNILLVGWSGVILICLDVIPFLGSFVNYYLEMVPFPTDIYPVQSNEDHGDDYGVLSSFRLTLVGVLLLNLLAVVAVERGARLMGP